MDQVPKAPAEESFASPSGSYLFVLRAPNDWQTEAPEGELIGRDGAAQTSLWRRALPQEYRARFALVSDQGRVLMLDEWWNIKSGYAVVVLDPEGRDLAVHDYAAVRAALGQSDKSLVSHAKHGWWLGGRPRLEAGGETATVEAGGKHLVIDLTDGGLTAQP